MTSPSRRAAAAALLQTVRAALAEAAGTPAGPSDATLRRALTALGVIERVRRDEGVALRLPDWDGDRAALARALRSGLVCEAGEGGEAGETGRTLHAALLAEAEDALAISNPRYLERLAQDGEAPW